MPHVADPLESTPTSAPVSVAAASYRSLWDLRRAHPSPLEFLEAQARRGDVVEFAIGRQKTLLLSHPSAIEHVLVTNGHRFSKAPALNRATRLLGRGLLTSEPPLHPERGRLMLPAFHRQRPKMAFIPFGAGRRACVGEAFAWMEGKVVLSTIAREWRLRLDGAPSHADLRITMRPAGPVVMAPSARVGAES